MFVSDAPPEPPREGLLLRPPWAPSFVATMWVTDGAEWAPQVPETAMLPDAASELSSALRMFPVAFTVACSWPTAAEPRTRGGV